MKKCIKCEKLLSECRFYAKHNGKLSSYCKSCLYIINRDFRKDNNNYKETCKQYNLKNKQKFKKDSKRRYLKYAYNLSSEEYSTLLKNTKGSCIICKNSFTKDRIPHIDHDHNSGKIRTIICGQCNRGLGYFNERKLSLFNSIFYLIKYKFKEIFEHEKAR